MGPLQVVLNVTNEHATVTFSSATPEVRQALEDALPRLREMMSESGIALGNATVNDGAAQQQDRDQPRGQGARVAANPTPDDGASGSAAQAEARVAARPLRGGELPGLVDTFA
jgi:flagellar hook-length control protein FliK